MATPTQTQARSHYDRQRKIVAAAALAVRSLIQRRRPAAEVATTIASYQMASATASVGTVAAWADAPQPLTRARAFAGVTSEGFSVVEALVATIDRVMPAPVEPVPDVWWDQRDVDTFLAQVEQMVASEVADAGRTASQVEFVSRPDWTNYIRMLNPPSCDRCTVLAGRIYRDLDAFARHPGCDCVMVPVTGIEAAKAEGLIADPMDAFDKGLVRGLSKADEQAIRDGADLDMVVNAKRAGIRAPAGITNAYTADVFGRRLKATLHGTTKRAQWRKNNPTRMVRLRPEAIYQIVEREYGGDREQAVRLLRVYGYIR